MRYRISKSQIKMLLDGKPLSMGNGRKVILLKGSEVYKRLWEIIHGVTGNADTYSFFTDGITVFVEEKE